MGKFIIVIECGSSKLWWADLEKPLIHEREKAEKFTDFAKAKETMDKFLCCKPVFKGHVTEF